MDQPGIDRIARYVADCRLDGGRLGQPFDKAESRDEALGYRVQTAANALLAERLGRVVGHKIGGTTAWMRRYLGIDDALGGEVFEATVHRSGAELPMRDGVRTGVETEIAVVLAHDLLPGERPFAADDVAVAVGALCTSIEIVEDRYQDFQAAHAALLLADNVFAAGCVLGEPVTDWRDLSLGELVATTQLDGVEVARGTADALMGHPLNALAWLANRRAALGRPLRAGEFVTLGSINPVFWLDDPTWVRIEVEGLGRVELGLGTHCPVG